MARLNKIIPFLTTGSRLEAWDFFHINRNSCVCMPAQNGLCVLIALFGENMRLKIHMYNGCITVGSEMRSRNDGEVHCESWVTPRISVCSSHGQVE